METYRWWDCAAAEELEREHFVPHDLVREPTSHHLRQRLLFRLSLTRKLRRTVTKPSYVILGGR